MGDSNPTLRVTGAGGGRGGGGGVADTVESLSKEIKSLKCRLEEERQKLNDIPREWGGGHIVYKYIYILQCLGVL